MKKIVFEKLYEEYPDETRELNAYKLGDWYLVKKPTWNNRYEWILNKDGCQSYFSHELDKEIESGNVILVESCKAGKQKLIELYEKEFSS